MSLEADETAEVEAMLNQNVLEDWFTEQNLSRQALVRRIAVCTRFRKKEGSGSLHPPEGTVDQGALIGRPTEL